MIIQIRKLSIFCFAIIFVTLISACTLKDEHLSLNSEEIAQKFSDIWIEKWENIEETGMLLPKGNAFLADLNTDGIPELFFFYPEWKNSTVCAFDISNEQIKEIGEFKCSLINKDKGLLFELYDESEGNPILHAESYLANGAANPTKSIVDYYVKYYNDNLEISTLYRTENANGENKYFNSSTGNTQISESEYEEQLTKIIGLRTQVKTIHFSYEDGVKDFLTDDNLKLYIESVINKWNKENDPK